MRADFLCFSRSPNRLHPAIPDQQTLTNIAVLTRPRGCFGGSSSKITGAMQGPRSPCNRHRGMADQLRSLYGSQIPWDSVGAQASIGSIHQRFAAFSCQAPTAPNLRGNGNQWSECYYSSTTTATTTAAIQCNSGAAVAAT